MAKRGRPPKIQPPSEAHHRVLDLAEEEYLSTKEGTMEDTSGGVMPRVPVAGENSDEFTAIELEQQKLWMAHSERQGLAHDAIAIATALLNSPRHHTLNEGLAKECVAFADVLRKESKRVSDSNQ